MTVRFLLIGGWNTIFGYGIFALLYLLLGDRVNYLVVALISHMIAVTQSFVSQRLFVFCTRGALLGEYLRFHLANIGLLFFGMVALPLGIEILRLSPLITQALIVVFSVTFSFFIHRHFTFRA